MLARLQGGMGTDVFRICLISWGGRVPRALSPVLVVLFPGFLISLDLCNSSYVPIVPWELLFSVTNGELPMWCSKTVDVD